jgi:hypothetical protein
MHIPKYILYTHDLCRNCIIIFGILNFFIVENRFWRTREPKICIAVNTSYFEELVTSVVGLSKGRGYPLYFV